MTPALQTYEHARDRWYAFYARTCAGHHAARLRKWRETSAGDLAETLRLLPAAEQRPVAFGVYCGASREWREDRLASFRDEFLADPSAAERDLVDVASGGSLRQAGLPPLTVEEFPSRIWRRALADGRTPRLARAARQAVEAMVVLLESYHAWQRVLPDCCLKHRRSPPEVRADDVLPPNPELPEGCLLATKYGDLPDELDLIALAPDAKWDLKGRMYFDFTRRAEANEYSVILSDLDAFLAWAYAEATGGRSVDIFLRKSRVHLDKFHAKTRSRRSFPHAEISLAGTVAYRLGLRRIAAEFDPMMQLRRRQVWHHLPIPPSRHARLRKALVRAGSDTTAWLRDPALACSGMTLPLWIADGVARVEELAALLERSSALPWVFPRLYHVFQWHLALAGRFDELTVLATLHPGDSWGLERPVPEKWQPIFPSRTASNPTPDPHPAAACAGNTLNRTT